MLIHTRLSFCNGFLCRVGRKLHPLQSGVTSIKQNHLAGMIIRCSASKGKKQPSRVPCEL